MEELGELMQFFSQRLQVGLNVLVLLATVLIILSQLRRQFLHVSAQVALSDGALSVDGPQAGTVGRAVTVGRRDTDSDGCGRSAKTRTAQGSGRECERSFRWCR